jgi:hypothetical protein
MRRLSVVLIVAGLLWPASAAAHTLSFGDAALATRLAVSDRADDDCLDIHDYSDGVETTCDFADYPESTRRDCWRLTRHMIKCEAYVTFDLTLVYDDGFEESVEAECRYRTLNRYRNNHSIWPQTRITSGPWGCE